MKSMGPAGVDLASRRARGQGPNGAGGHSAQSVREALDRLYLERLLPLAAENPAAALQAAGVSRSSYANMLKKHGLGPSAAPAKRSR